MTIELLRKLAEKAAYIYMKIPTEHILYDLSYTLWNSLEKELTAAEIKEAE